MAKKVAIIFGCLLGISVVLVAGLMIYLGTHKAEISQKIKDLSNKNLQGSLDFENLNVSLFSTFPNFSLEVSGLRLHTLDSAKNTSIKLADIPKVYLVLSLQNLLRKKILLKGIRLSEGQVHIFKNREGFSSLQILKNKQKDENDFENLLKMEEFSVEIEKVKVLIEDLSKNQKLSFKLNTFENRFFQRGQDKYEVWSKLNANIDSLAFNLDRGAYLSRTPVQGDFNSKWEHGKIKVMPFNLKVGDQMFKSDFEFGIRKDGDFAMNFSNPKTQWQPSMKVLTKRVQKILSPIKVEGDIKTLLKISGKFKPNYIPLVTLKIDILDQKLIFNKDLTFKNFNVKANWVNRRNPNTLKVVETKQDLTLSVNSLNAELGKIKIQTKTARLSTSPVSKKILFAAIDISGASEGLNELLKNKNFLFKSGFISGKLRINCEANDLRNELFDNMHGVFGFSDCKVFHVASNLNFTVEDMKFEMTEDLLDLSNMDVRLGSNSILNFKGQLRNYQPLIFDRSTKNVTSKLSLNAIKIDWEDVKRYMNANQGAQTKARNRESVNKLKLVLSSLNNRFHPTLNIKIAEFRMGKFKTKNVSGSLFFNNNNKLSLTNTGLDFERGRVQMNTTFDWSQTDKTDIKTNLKADNFDVAAFAESFDYFGIDALKNAKNIEGVLDLNTNLSAVSDDQTGLVKSSLNGKVAYKVSNVELEEFDPLMKIGGLVFKKERVQKVKMKTIENELDVRNSKITFPQTSVASSALNFTFEGVLDYAHHSNMFMTIPLANLNRREAGEIPDIENDGKNVYVYAVEDKYGKMNYFLKLRDKRNSERFQKKVERKIERSEKRQERKLKKSG